MGIAFVIAVCIGAAVTLFYIRLRADIRSLYRQLEEIRRGSHMELFVDSRQKPLLELCVRLNEVLALWDTKRVKYENAQRILKQDITSLAHDIRTPLTGAAGYMQLARECETPDKRERYLTAAEKRLTELGEMLEEMFLYTKLVGENFSLSIGKVYVLPVLSDCLLSMYVQFEEQGITPKVAFESEKIQVEADEEALKRIFNNLLQNALVHGTGALSVTQTGSRLVFENAVPKKTDIELSLIFDRFYKADKSRSKGSSGLGLFIVKELMERMGGSVRAELSDEKIRIILVFKTQPD